ncbi:MAG: malto-oligosyltrehalose synthase, partial [Stellaceae bacterium]
SQRARAETRTRAEALKAALARKVGEDPALRATIDRALRHFSGVKGDRSSFVPLHRLLEGQHYRLAYWRVAADEINYRRFFDINELAGVRVEKPDVFKTVHGLVLRLVAEGKIDGLRIDHIDGLYDPEEYCRRLADRLDEVSTVPGARYLVVEKILARHETRRREWPIAGTTGYDALNLLNGLFVEGRAERAVNRVYRRFIGRALDLDEVIYDAKRLVMDTLLAGELEVLTAGLDRISEASWHTRDFTFAGLKAALREVVACFPVYRTYVTERGTAADDRRDIDWAVAQARRKSTSGETTIFDFVHDALTADIAYRAPHVFPREAVINFAMKFQQLTGPVTAKAVEDTAFYRYTRLLSLNEVGGDPGRFAVTRAAFHHLNRDRQRHWPHTMIATATHDTKRGEDARARLDVLTEFPAEWGQRLRRWSVLNRSAKSAVDGVPAPSADDEFLLYQTLLGAWPMAFLGEKEPDATPLATFRDRIAGYMVKAVREAKLNSRWATPNLAYEAALEAFIERLLDPARSAGFFADLQNFATRIALPGMINGLAQLVLKLTVPGVPDIYQGGEFWDLNLVDPDNRRAVDFAARAAALAALPAPGDSAAVAALLDAWPDGRIKLHLAAALLRARRERPLLFAAGGYLPLQTRGEFGRRLCAFARRHDESAMVVIVPRLVVGLGAGQGRMPVGSAWTDSMIVAPASLAARGWSNLLSGERVLLAGDGEDRGWRAHEMFRTLPVAVLIAEPG